MRAILIGAKYMACMYRPEIFYEILQKSVLAQLLPAIELY